MNGYEPIASLGVALAVGLLIGLQRQQAVKPAREESGQFLGGARTYPLFSLAGGLSVLLGRELGPWLPVLTLTLMVGLLGVAYADDVRHGRDRGLTSEAAFVVTFLLGGLVLTQGVIEPAGWRFVVVAATAVVVTSLLSVKAELHGMIARTSREDVYATLKFLLVAVLILPLLPNETFGPLDVLNPFSIGLMVVLIAGIGFVGYVSIRLLGPGRGLGLTGAVGGLASSTAVTLSFAGRAKAHPELARPAAAAVVLASSIMFPRVLVEIAVVHPALLPQVALPMGLMTAAGLIASATLYLRSRRRERPEGEVEFSNPFELGSALKFGLLFALVLLASKAATEWFGTSGTYVAGVLAGATDVDAITLSMASLAREGLSLPVAATSIVLGAGSNTLVKAGLAIGLGGWAFGREIALAFGLVLAAGAVGVLLLWL